MVVVAVCVCAWLVVLRLVGVCLGGGVLGWYSGISDVS